MRAALEGADVAYYLVHSLGSSDFERRDRAAAETVAREASAAGLRQIIYLGGLGDDSPDLSPHLRSRIETGRALASGSVPVTTLRAAMVVGAGSAAFETILALVDRLPAMICPRWVSTPTQPIALDDVVAYLAGACGREDLFGESLDVGGREVMTYREMIEQIGRLRGRRLLIVEVPVLTPRLSSYWLRLVTPVGAKVARPLIEGLRTATIVRDDRIRRADPLRADALRRGRRSGGRGAQVGEHGEHAPVALGRVREPELAEDRADVRLDRLLRQPQLLRDARVRAALGDESEHLALAR